MARELIQYSLEESFNDFTNPAALRESRNRPTVAGGEYIIQAAKVDRVGEEEVPGSGVVRKFIAVQAKVIVDGKPKATVFFDASEEMRKTPKGYPDKAYRFWGQLLNALYPAEKVEEQSSHSVKDVADKLITTPIKVYLTESFLVPKADGSGNTWQSAEGDEAVELRARGCDARNYVQSILKPR